MIFSETITAFSILFFLVIVILYVVIESVRMGYLWINDSIKIYTEFYLTFTAGLDYDIFSIVFIFCVGVFISIVSGLLWFISIPLIVIYILLHTSRYAVRNKQQINVWLNATGKNDEESK